MDRERITITCKKSLLSKIDSIIDGVNIRNRSHAIEYLITQSLVPQVRQAVILAGGKGLNMRPFTFEMPKGLFPVAGKPILEHIVDLLRNHSIVDIIFSIGHLGEKIREYFGDGKKFGVKITYVLEEKEMGTGGALLLAKKHIHSDTFLALHGDILTDINLSDLVAFHNEQDSVATLALTSVVDTSNFGEVVLHGTKITQFREKPQKGKQTSQLVNSGLYVLRKSIFEHIPHGTVSHLEDIFPTLAQEGKLTGFLFAGKWIDIGTPKSYEQAITQWREK
ncbi:nucleotidyltransferase family protein [Candidatus Gottesmanbacteria bacterium]|nr:nucleotidyltransferase family protein [Candidatus Gottesmanbacteria bacterium]